VHWFQLLFWRISWSCHSRWAQRQMWKQEILSVSAHERPWRDNEWWWQGPTSGGGWGFVDCILKLLSVLCVNFCTRYYTKPSIFFARGKSFEWKQVFVCVLYATSTNRHRRLPQTKVRMIELCVSNVQTKNQHWVKFI
jgi:hypothetical protein